MLTVFFDWEGVTHHEYTLQAKQLIRSNYLHVLHWLRDAIWQKQPQLWAAGDWQLHHNNTPAHTSHLVQSVLAKHQITQVFQHLYSQDLMPCDFWLFPELKSPLKGKRFQTIDEIQENRTEQLMTVPTKDFTVFWTVEEMLGELCEVPRCLLWRGLRCHCPMYNVSCI